METCPNNKKVFESEAHAVRFDAYLYKKHAADASYTYVRQYPYVCPQCKQWHLTSKFPGAPVIARVHYAPVTPPVVSNSGPRGIQTEDVIKLKAEGQTIPQIAAHFEVTTAAIAYHLNKPTGTTTTAPRFPKPKSLSLSTLSEVSERKRMLQQQLDVATREEERLLESAKMKVFYDRKVEGVVVTKNAESVTLLLSDIEEICELYTTGALTPQMETHSA